MPIGAAVLPAAMPTPTMRPPSRTLSNACTNVSARPSASNATSAPAPPVSLLTAGATSSRLAFTTSVAPNRRAASSFSSLMSTATICDAPNAFATWMIDRPTPPAATTATRSPPRRSAACRTAP